MNFRVEWLQSVEADLQTLWQRTEEIDALTGYAEQIDKILARNPMDQGESRSQGIRVWIRRPLGVLYHVDDNIKLVRIRRIRWIGR
jgi:hypothetical protein